MEQNDHDPLGAALKAYSNYFGLAEPSADLPAAIMSGIEALRPGEKVLPVADLRAFLHILASDRALQDQLSYTAGRADFIGAFTQAATKHGFRILDDEVYSLFRRFEVANDGELTDEQLDSVAAAAQDDFQLVWQLFRDKT